MPLKLPELCDYFADQDQYYLLFQGFAMRFPRVYKKGMPGPSLSWSAFSNSAEDAASRLFPEEDAAEQGLSLGDSGDPQVLPLVLERFDESLVLMADYLGWRLADAGWSLVQSRHTVFCLLLKCFHHYIC